MADRFSVDSRTPRPDPRVDALGMAAAAALAATAYVVALVAGQVPSRGFAVVLLSAAPVLAAVAAAVLVSRASAKDDDALRWLAAGVLAGLPAMVLQLVSFPLVVQDGGVLRTSPSSSAALYLMFHFSLIAGAVLGLVRAPSRRRTAGVALLVLLSVGLATDAVPLPRLLSPAGDFSSLLIAIELGMAVVAGGCAVMWLVRAGRAARPLHTAAAVALSLSAYDLLLNAVAAQRFDAVWWSSLSMRVATYGLLAAVAVGYVLQELARSEQYTDAELARREGQLRDSLDRASNLLAVVSRNAQALERALLPNGIVSLPGFDVAARHRTADVGDGGAFGDGGASGDGEQDAWTGWFDTIALPSQGVALVVGQVEARDPDAAPVVGLVRGAVRSYALEGHPPSVVLERADTFLRSAGADRPVAVAYAEVYPDDRIATVAIAGGACVVLAGLQSTSLGLRPGPSLGLAADGLRREEQTVLVPAGASLVLTTGSGLSPRVPVSVGAGNGEAEAVADVFAAAVPPTEAVAVVVAQPHGTHRATVSRTLPVHRLSAAVSRLWIADLFAVWSASGDLPDGPTTDEAAGTAALLLTELVSNAVRHSDMAVHVAAQVRNGRLRVGVSDNSHRMPMLRTASTQDTSGRGLQLVNALASAWGVDPTERGKTVWFELDPRAETQVSELDEDALMAAFSDDPSEADGLQPPRGEAN